MSGSDARAPVERDERLMLALADGDLASLGELYRRHMPKVHDLCCRLTGGEAADDLVQETFLRVLRHRRGFRGEARFSTWIYRIARNVCLDHLRANRQRAARERRGVVADNAVRAEPREPPDELPALERALARLAPEKREVLILSRYYDLDNTEVAEILGCSVGAVKVRVHRALKEVRRLMMDTERESDEMRASRSSDS